MSNKEAYYFSHDSNARNDFKIIKLRRILGLEGYGIYFCLIEMLREQKDYKLLLESVVDFAYTLDVSEEKIKSVIMNFDLFEIEENTFFSARLLRSMKVYKSISQKRIEAGRRGGQANAKQMLSKTEANAKQMLSNAKALKERKGKEIKLKERKEKYLDYVFLSEDEFGKLVNKFSEDGTNKKIENLNNYIGSTGKKYKSHYHTILAWESKYNQGNGKTSSMFEEHDKIMARIAKEKKNAEKRI